LKAIILAAGLGTRLMPMTIATPKALVKINSIPMLELVIRKLAKEGCTDIIVNVHHLAGQVMEFIAGQDFPGVNISISDESRQLLDTGGAILKARWFLDGNEAFLVHNVDVMSDISLKSLLAEHRERGGLVTLPVLDRPTKRYFLFDDDLRLRGWTDTSSGETRWAGAAVENSRMLAFSGIHVISPEIFSLMKEKGTFSIIGTYLNLAGERSIYGSLQTGHTWFDLGKPDQLKFAENHLKANPEFMAKL
jgi:N-acetyl-alpha-D-muramate 1-phosphate uridylyltransferase